MGDKKKKKKTTMLIRLVSSARTGYFYVTQKPPGMTKKLELRKYDPQVKLHVLFTEAKIK